MVFHCRNESTVSERSTFSVHPKFVFGVVEVISFRGALSAKTAKFLKFLGNFPPPASQDISLFFFLQATKSIYFVRDDSGRIDAMQWKDESSSAGEDIEENSYIRVIGSVRLISNSFRASSLYLKLYWVLCPIAARLWVQISFCYGCSYQVNAKKLIKKSSRWGQCLKHSHRTHAYKDAELRVSFFSSFFSSFPSWVECPPRRCISSCDLMYTATVLPGAKQAQYAQTNPCQKGSTQQKKISF